VALARKLQSRLQELGLKSCSEYLKLLQRPGTKELDELISQLTIGETYFFRNRPHFKALETLVLPKLLAQRQPEKELAIWSAGCATGPEPYSINLLLRHRMFTRLTGWTVSILASDINSNFLETAREGKFSQWAFRAISDDYLRNCFRQEGATWSILPKFKDINFVKHNLVADSFPPTPTIPEFDLIVCRNVLIYFSVDIIRTLVAKLHSCLRPGGWLLVGHAEPNIELFSEFETVRTEQTILYRKREKSRFVHPSPEPAPPVITEPTSSLKAETRTRTAVSDDERLQILTDQGRWDEAYRFCQDAIERNPLRAQHHFMMALIHQHFREVEARDACLDKALYLERGFILAHYYKGVFESERGRAEEAGRSFRSVLRLLDAQDPCPDLDTVTMAPEQLRRMSKYYLTRLGQDVG